MTVDNKTDKAAGRVLLPSYVQPQSYDLNVKPDLKAYTFDGIVSIEMTTAEDFSEDESKKITLHSKELMYRTAEFQTSDGKVVKADEVSGWYFSLNTTFWSTIFCIFVYSFSIFVSRSNPHDFFRTLI